jgi:pimeloyl-ACP methyl ester carboxylesterase
MTLQHKTAQVGDVTLHYVEDGEGPLVVLLHGFPESWYSWRHQIPALVAAGFRVIAPDLRGYNDSSKPADVAAYRITEIVKDIAGLIVQSGDSPCRVVAHDWGGVAAWFHAMMHPEQIERLAVLNSPHPVPLSREVRRSMQQKLRLSYQLFFRMRLLPNLFIRFCGGMLLRGGGRFTPEDVATYRKQWRKAGAIDGMLNWYRALPKSRSELRQFVRPIEAPVMIVWGDHDPVFTLPTIENFSEYVPNLRVERISTAGHFVQTDEPARVSELLIDFLR